MRLKKGALLAALGLAAVGIAVFASGRQAENPTGEVVSATIKHRGGSAQASSGEVSRAIPTFDLRSLRNTGPSKIQTSSLMQARSWYTPPPPPPAPKVAAPALPPPLPTPPQVPFAYIGKMVDRKKVLVFLLKNDIQYVAQANDVLDGTYRVDRISDDEVVLTYIPMNAQQTLSLSRQGEGARAPVLPGPSGLPQVPPQLAQQRNLAPFVKQ